MALWLSKYIFGIEISSLVLSSSKSLCNHFNSLTPSQAATYSASVVERATIDCLRENHEIGPPANVTTYPLVECLFSRSPA